MVKQSFKWQMKLITIKYQLCLTKLNYLFQHQVKPEFTCRFVWAPGSIALWDNRCAQHNPVNDYHGFKRLLHRITLAGERPA